MNGGRSEGYNAEYQRKGLGNSQTTYTPCPIIADFLSFEAEDQFVDASIYYKVQEMHTKAKIEFHGVNRNIFNSHSYAQNFEMGLKIGFKSNIARIAQTTKAATSQDYSTPEGMLNGYFAALEAYENILTLLRASQSFGIKAGAWFYMEGDTSSTKTEQSIAVPTIYDVGSLASYSEELQFHGTQIKAYQAYLETNKLTAQAALNTASAKSSSKGGSGELNALNFGAGFSMFMSNSNQQQSVPFTVHISVTDRLDLKVAGHADLKGAWIEAGELHAAFNSLMMESMYSISKYHQWGASLGFDTSDLSGSLGGSIKNGERHVIEEITTLLGRNSAVIIVAKALELNGAMIAAAQRNPDGTFTDHGQLTLNFGEIFLKHLHGYDDGITLGAAINLRGHLQDDNFVKRFTFGMHKEEQTVYATVGQGPGDIPGANRDVNQAVKNRVKVNIDPINAYFSNYDFAAAHEEIKQGGARFILRTAAGIFNTIVDPLFELYYKFTKPSPEPELEPEEPEENPKPNEEEPEEKPKKEVKPKKKQEATKEKVKEQDATEGNSFDSHDIYDTKEVYGPKEVFRVEYDEAAAKIDKLDVSDEHKREFKEGLYYHLKAESKKEIAKQGQTSWTIGDLARHGADLFNKIFGINKAEASVGKVIKGTAAACLDNAMCRSIAIQAMNSVSNMISDVYNKKPHRSYDSDEDFMTSDGTYIKKEKVDKDTQKSYNGKSGATAGGTPDPDDGWEPKKDDSNLNTEDRRAVNSLKNHIESHKQKLENYKQNPDSFDNKDFLKNAPNEEVRNNIIKGRIQHLQQEINVAEEQIKNIMKKYKK